MSKSALVVDDSASMRQMVCFTLQTHGFDTTEACDGQDALKRSQGKEFNIVITDVNMPNMDGITLIRNLREQAEFKFTPMIMLTTESQESKKQEGKSAGATGWMIKPFNPDQLMMVVNKVVR
jgi:two-component system chemotaxis response regulator CheY